MKHSSHRILTTHAGRLDGPPEWRELTVQSGQAGAAALEAKLPEALADVIHRQVDAGVDIISDGEVGKVGFGLEYYGTRLSGLAARPIKEGESGWMALATNERLEFADFL